MVEMTLLVALVGVALITSLSSLREKMEEPLNTAGDRMVAASGGSG